MNSQQLQERIESLIDEVSETLDSDLSERTNALYNWLYETSVHRQTVSDLHALLALQTDLINALLEQSENAPKPMQDSGFVPMSTYSGKRPDIILNHSETII